MFVKLPKDCIKRKFSELSEGDLVLYDIIVLMKVSPVPVGTGTQTLNSVNMHNGQLEFIAEDTLIKVVGGELVVSYAIVVD